jgi:RHS repeat-associated protein
VAEPEPHLRSSRSNRHDQTSGRTARPRSHAVAIGQVRIPGEARPTIYGYDTAGQLATVTQRVDPANPATAITVNLGYDQVGNKTRMVDGNGNATTYTYNTWNRPESTIEAPTTTHPNAADRTWSTTYNTVGLPTVDTLPGGVTQTRTYDNLGRLTAETGTGAEAATTTRGLDYDPLGRTTSATSPAGNLTFTYTDRGQLATATGYGGTTTYQYDADNHATNRTDTAGAASFGYDTAGRLTSIVDPLSGTTATIGYDTTGRLATVGYGTSRPSRSYGYDNLGRIYTDTTTNSGGTTSASITYLYDRDNLVTSKTTTGLTGAGANTYTYDGLSRVTSWLNPGGTTTSYGYDNASNRTTVTTPAGTRTSTYDQRNRITATTGAGQTADTYAFNPRGDLTTTTRSGVSTTYTYDAFDRLTSAAASPGAATTYAYDSLDRAAQRNGTNFAYNDLTNNPVSTPAASGETKLLRDLTGKPLTFKTASNSANLLLADTAHGDVDAGYDPTTGIIGPSTDYNPWGAPTSTTGTTPPIGFQGGYTDPDTGLVNAHARWYDPTLGEFTARDTLTLAPDPVAQANRYLYANNSPLNARDTDGHRQTCTDPDDDSVHSCTQKEMGPDYPSPAEHSNDEAKAQAQAKTAATNACNHDTQCNAMNGQAGQNPTAKITNAPQIVCDAADSGIYGCPFGLVMYVPANCVPNLNNAIWAHDLTLRCILYGPIPPNPRFPLDAAGITDAANCYTYFASGLKEAGGLPACAMTARTSPCSRSE